MCDDLRTEHDDEMIEKWITGKTGFPFLDACMKFLQTYGWINFGKFWQVRDPAGQLWPSSRHHHHHSLSSFS